MTEEHYSVSVALLPEDLMTLKTESQAIESLVSHVRIALSRALVGRVSACLRIQTDLAISLQLSDSQKLKADDARLSEAITAAVEIERQYVPQDAIDVAPAAPLDQVRDNGGAV